MRTSNGSEISFWINFQGFVGIGGHGIHVGCDRVVVVEDDVVADLKGSNIRGIGEQLMMISKTLYVLMEDRLVYCMINSIK